MNQMFWIHRTFPWTHGKSMDGTIFGNGTPGKISFSVAYDNNHRPLAARAFIFTQYDLSAHIRNCVFMAFRFSRNVHFRETWKTQEDAPGNPLMPSVMCIFADGGQGILGVHSYTYTITARTFFDLKRVAAVAMHRPPFAPVGACFFGFDRDALLAVDPRAVEGATFRWQILGNSRAEEGGWPLLTIDSPKKHLGCGAGQK